MTFLRLSRGHVVAAVAALALLLVTAVDWYTSDAGEEARRIESITEPPAPGLQGEIDREVLESSSITAEQEEANAWQADGALDRIVLVLVIATVVLALLAAAVRARERRPGRLAPSVLAAGVAAVAALLLMARIIDVGSQPGGQVEIGAPLALVALAALAIGAARAARVEREQPGPAVPA